MRVGVDPWPRIDFFVSHGLLEKRPTVAQLKQAGKLNVYDAGLTERLLTYGRDPRKLLPSRARTWALRVSSQAIQAGAMRHGPAGGAQAHARMVPEGAPATPALLFDCLLQGALRWAPLRFMVACAFNPYGWSVPGNAVAATGLTTPLKPLIAHVLHTPHPFGLWDVQIIQADEGGLDQLERELERATTSRALKYRLYRAMAQRDGYYEHLRDLIARARRFDYPPVPPGYNPVGQDLVQFLRFALSL
jgi:hypothetical protein